METKAFLEQLRASGLLVDRQLPHGVRALLPFVSSGRKLARALFQRRLLTPFQCHHLLAGTGSSLAIGAYRLVERLGRGATGQTFRAFHAGLKRPVVLHLLAADDADTRAGYRDAMLRLARLSHPYLLTVFDGFEVDGQQVLVWEYVQGTDLPGLVRHAGPLPVSLACDLVRQAALGVQHAYDGGFRHAGLRPENVVIVDRILAGTKLARVVKLLHVGLPYFAGVPVCEKVFPGETGPAEPFTATMYQAPELAKAPDAANPRSDVYTLGWLLHYALAGRPTEPRPLERVRPEVPAKLADRVRRMLAKEPVARQRNAARVARDLAPFCGAATLTLPAAAVIGGSSETEAVAVTG